MHSCIVLCEKITFDETAKLFFSQIFFLISRKYKNGASPFFLHTLQLLNHRKASYPRIQAGVVLFFLLNKIIDKSFYVGQYIINNEIMSGLQLPRNVSHAVERSHPYTPVRHCNLIKNLQCGCYVKDNRLKQ